MPNKKLMQVRYFDKKAEINVSCYADTAVIENDDRKSYLAAIRLGGYPESVKSVSDAIFGGATVTIEIDGETRSLMCHVKRYRREYSHDGLYAEAVLRLKDEEQQQMEGGDGTDDVGKDNSKNKDKDKRPPADMPRKCYIFCGAGDDAHLFEEVDKKISVPLIPEFQDYVLNEFQSRDILKPLEVISANEKFDAWVLVMSSDEQNIISAVNDGLYTGEISIPGACDDSFPSVHGVTQYLNKFGVSIAERIKSQFKPLFDPAEEPVSPEVLAVNDHIKKNTNYSLYDAQLAVVESHKRNLKYDKVTLCIAACGSGKSKIGTSALHAYQQSKQQIKVDKADKTHKAQVLPHVKHFNIVLCPSHMLEKWVREIEEALPNTFAVIITSISELNTAYQIYERGNKTCYVIITKEKARDGYQRRPAAMWSKRREAFICPSCYDTLEMDVFDRGSKYRVPADPFFFRKETKQNRKCENCDSLLWTALAPEHKSEWVKVSDYGFVHRYLINMYFQLADKKPKLYDAIQAIADNPNGHFPNAGAYRRFALSTYIKNKMKGKIDGLVVDELHNYNNNSGQGDAMGELFQAAKKVVGMTATLINGYSSGIFHLLYRISPDLMLRDNKSYEKPIDFNTEYGVTESTYEIDDPDYNANRRTTKRKVREKQLPGVSPMVYSRFLMENAAFLSLEDMGKDLPEYEEIPIQLQMNGEVALEYVRLESQFIDILKYQKDIAKKILSVYLNLLTVYPDQPYGHKPVVHPISGNDMIIPQDMSSIGELHEKDRRVLEIVKQKMEACERVLIYTSWTRIDTQDKLSHLLAEEGFRTTTLTASVSPKKREEWVEKQVQDGVQVLITNPSLVETGLDLNDFTTIIYYNISYNLFTLRQASRRSWRINQRAPRIEVYFMYYKNTMQHRAIRLMASKLAVAGVIEGNLTDEGLAAMSDCQDMTTALARELTQGIEGEIEDLGAVFKRMALLKDKVDVAGAGDVIEGTVVDVYGDIIDAKDIAQEEPAVSVATIIHTDNTDPVQSTEDNEQPTNLMPFIPTPKPKRKRKPAVVHENQMTLFDLLADAV